MLIEAIKQLKLVESKEGTFATWLASINLEIDKTKDENHYPNSLLLNLLEASTERRLSSQVLWKLNRYFDENYKLDADVRFLVEKETGLTLEKTPFIWENSDEVVTKMNKSAYSAACNKAEYIKIIVDNETTTFRISIIYDVVIKMLAHRLRRLTW